MTVKEKAYESYNRDQGLVYRGKELINEVMLKAGFAKAYGCE